MKHLIKTILFGLSTVYCVGLMAQDVDFKGANFKDDKDGLKSALENIKTGDESLELGNLAVVEVNDVKDHFIRALYHYEKAQKSEDQSLNETSLMVYGPIRLTSPCLLPL